MPNRKDDIQTWLISDRFTVHDGDRQIPPKTPFKGDSSLIKRGIARKADRSEIGDSDAA